MLSIPYDASRKSLYHPGEADDFFQFGPIQDDAALCAEMSRLAYVKDERRLAQYLDRAGFQQDLAIGYGSGGTQVFIASKLDDKLAVAAFRGTEPDDPSDLFTDANFILTPWAESGMAASIHYDKLGLFASARNPRLADEGSASLAGE